jgi:hypothetical protein
MQISGVSLALTWPHRLCLLRVLCTNCCFKLSPFQAHWGRWHCTRFLRPVCLFTVHVGSGSSPLSCGVFLPSPLLQAFLPLIAGRCCCFLLLGVFVYSSCGRWVFPPSPVEFSSPCHSHKFSRSWLLGTPLLPPEPLQPASACLFTVPGRIPLPPSSELRVPHPLCHVSLLFLLLITQFVFFPWVGVSLSRGLCWSGLGLSVEVLHTA